MLGYGQSLGAPTQCWQELRNPRQEFVGSARGALIRLAAAGRACTSAANRGQTAVRRPYIESRYSAGMQVAKEVEREQPAGATGTARPPPDAMPDAEIKRMFISLIDPTAMARTDRCLHTAELIGAYSAGAGWDKGVRLARMLGDVYGDLSKIADMPDVKDVYGHALRALGDVLAYLRRVGKAYRDGEDTDPMEGLEEVRATVAQVLSAASRIKLEDPDGEEEDDPDMPAELVVPKIPPQTCRKALMRSEWALRKRFKEWGGDYIFPPEVESIYGMLSKYAVPGITSQDMVREVRSRELP